MNNDKPFRRLMAMALSVVMVLGLAPVSAAETLPIGASGEIIAFEELAPEITMQQVPTGTEESALILPKTLIVSVQSGSVPEDPGPVSLELTVTWQSTPEYDGSTAGEYIFTPIIPDGFTQAEGVAPPQISVTVEEPPQIPVTVEEQPPALRDVRRLHV